MTMDIERGWIYLADLEPQHGTESGKTRPVLVIQTDLLNRQGHPSTLVIPLTTNVVSNAKPLRVGVPKPHKGFSQVSDLMIDQIRAIDNLRLYRRDSKKLIKKIVQLESGLMAQVEDCIKKVFDLN